VPCIRPILGAQRPEGGGTDKKDDGAKWRNELEATKAAQKKADKK
jgi:hypothetical protein